jgi:hypothetical protein
LVADLEAWVEAVPIQKLSDQSKTRCAAGVLPYRVLRRPGAVVCAP